MCTKAVLQLFDYRGSTAELYKGKVEQEHANPETSLTSQKVQVQLCRTVTTKKSP